MDKEDEAVPDPFMFRKSLVARNREKRRRDDHMLPGYVLCPGSLGPGIPPHAIQVFERRKKTTFRGATCDRCGIQVNGYRGLWALDSEGKPHVAASLEDASFMVEQLDKAKAALAAIKSQRVKEPDHA